MLGIPVFGWVTDKYGFTVSIIVTSGLAILFSGEFIHLVFRIVMNMIRAFHLNLYSFVCVCSCQLELVTDSAAGNLPRLQLLPHILVLSHVLLSRKVCAVTLIEI